MTHRNKLIIAGGFTLLIAGVVCLVLLGRDNSPDTANNLDKGDSPAHTECAAKVAAPAKADSSSKTTSDDEELDKILDSLTKAKKDCPEVRIIEDSDQVFSLLTSHMWSTNKLLFYSSSYYPDTLKTNEKIITFGRSMIQLTGRFKGDFTKNKPKEIKLTFDTTHNMYIPKELIKLQITQTPLKYKKGSFTAAGVTSVLLDEELNHTLQVKISPGRPLPKQGVKYTKTITITPTASGSCIYLSFKFAYRDIRQKYNVHASYYVQVKP